MQRTPQPRRSGIKKSRKKVTVGLFVTVVLSIAIFTVRSAPAQTYRTLHTFLPGEPHRPTGELIADPAGNLYGTAFTGGDGLVGGVFKIDSGMGRGGPIYEFKGLPGDGSGPQSGLLADGLGNLYGTTSQGGAYGGGTVFKLNKSGEETVLHSFSGDPPHYDGQQPNNSLVLDSGNLYGATWAGGGSGKAGILYKLDMLGNETILYKFSYTNGYPEPNLLLHGGRLYGVNYGDYYVFCGTVFRLNLATGVLATLYDFGSIYDDRGCHPAGGVIRDASGTLYGATRSGGAFQSGTVFKLDATGRILTTLYHFTGYGDGGTPGSRLVMDGAGNLYGTTDAGGDFGYGVIFKLDPNGVLTVLHSFSEGGNYQHNSGLYMDAAGVLYGTTSAQDWNGSVYALTP